RFGRVLVAQVMGGQCSVSRDPPSGCARGVAGGAVRMRGMRRKGFIAIACLPALLTLAPGALALPRITAVACFSGDAPPALGQAWTLSPLLLGPLVLFVLYVAG